MHYKGEIAAHSPSVASCCLGSVDGWREVWNPGGGGAAHADVELGNVGSSVRLCRDAIQWGSSRSILPEVTMAGSYGGSHDAETATQSGNSFYSRHA